MADSNTTDYAESSDGCEFHHAGMELAERLLSELSELRAGLVAIGNAILDVDERVAQLEQDHEHARAA
jgi:hypothetical protein